MSSYLLFAVLGLGPGAVYALLGLGLVLQQRSSGVINFAHGAVAMFVAYVYLQLREQGELIFPWIGIPHAVSIGTGPLSIAPAFALSLVYAALLGLVFYVLIFRPLRTAPALGRVGASVGLMLMLSAIAVLNFGTQVRTTSPILPSKNFKLLGAFVPSGQIWLAIVAVGLAAVLAAGFRFTRFGLKTRASAENERAAVLLALEPSRIAAANWMLATVLAGVAGILIAPITAVAPGTYTLFVVPALAAALVGGFRSFGLTIAGGLFLGAGQSELLKLQTVWTWLPQQGLTAGFPLLIVIAAMGFFGRGVVSRTSLRLGRSPTLGRPTMPIRTAALALAAGTVLLFALSPVYRAGAITSILAIPACLSVVVITGYVGQISLVQMGFAGVSGFALTHLATDAGIPFPLSLLLAALVAVPIGLVIALPTLRLRGVNLAVITLTAAAAMDALVFNNDWFTGGFSGRSAGRLHLFGFDVSIAGTTPGDYPRAVFGVVALVVVILLALLVVRLRLSSLGRTLIAVRENERAAASIGIDVPRVKLFAFSFAAFVAGIGGGLYAYQQVILGAASFSLFASLTVLAITYVGGVARISGAVAAAMLVAQGGLVVAIFSNVIPSLGKYQVLIAGVALIAMVIANPDGIAGEMEKGVAAFRRLYRRLRPAVQPRAVALAPAPRAAPFRVEGKAGEVLLVTDHLRVTYGGVVAVDDASLTIARGGITGLIGPNGAGKTTFVDAVTGYCTPAAGRVAFAGRDLTGAKPHVCSRRGLVRTFQSVELFEELSVSEQLLAAAERPPILAGVAHLFGLYRGDDDRAVDWALEATDLLDVADRKVSEIPAGRRKLVGVARALVCRPDLLLLDEPASGLDTHESTALGSRLQAIAERGVTVLLVDHDMSLVLSVCDRVVVMDFGRLIADGTPEHVRSDPAVIGAYLGGRAKPGHVPEPMETTG